MRAILLEANPDVAALLPCVCNAVAIPLTVVGNLAALQRALARARPDDVVIVDCSLERPEDAERCAQVVRHAGVLIYILHARAAFVQDMAAIARARVRWLPTTVGLLEVLPLLRALQAEVLAARGRRPRRPLTARQQHILALVAQGHSHREIAAALAISSGSVKRQVARIKEKLQVTTTAELRIAYRWMTAGPAAPS